MNDEIKNLLKKLSVVRSVAQELMAAAEETEADKWRLPFYRRLIDGVDRRAELFGAQGIGIPHSVGGASIGLYQGISEWCEDDGLIAAVTDVEDFYLKLQGA